MISYATMRPASGRRDAPPLCRSRKPKGRRSRPRCLRTSRSMPPRWRAAGPTGPRRAPPRSGSRPGAASRSSPPCLMRRPNRSKRVFCAARRASRRRLLASALPFGPGTPGPPRRSAGAAGRETPLPATRRGVHADRLGRQIGRQRQPAVQARGRALNDDRIGLFSNGHLHSACFPAIQMRW